MDINQNILGCNDSQAHTMGLSCSQDSIGKSIADFYSPEESTLIINNNESILKKNSPKLFEEFKVLTASQKVIYSSYKFPIKGGVNQFLGVSGISIPIEIVSCKTLHNNNGLPSELQSLTPLQLQCLYFVLIDWSLTKITKKINASIQLIELHLHHIFLKLNCTSLNELKVRSAHISPKELARLIQSPSITENSEDNVLVPHRTDNHLVKLTTQQSRCFRLLLKGFTAKDIAQTMNLSYRTIEHYTLAIYKRLGLTTHRELISHYSFLLN